ncbi:MAG: aminotransferase class I/II-fold pyridoxal phosphate-dependent enzyme [Candidatus Eisenbacteria bacterium]
MFATYPFVEIERKKRARIERGLDVIDLSIGDPRELTPSFLVEAVRSHVPTRSSYPTVLGRPELRAAIAGWFARRYRVALDPETQILPANGSKEAVFNIHLALIDPASPRRRVVIPSPAYPVYERGAAFAGGVPTLLPLTRERGFLPDLSAVPEAVWRETALLWLNYPHNPTGAGATSDLYAQALALARRHGFVVLSDEAYSELTFGAPAPSLLASGIERALVFQTLSKRSAMTGFRSGFVAGDPALVATFRSLRPSLGVATPEFVQHAAEAAWNDEAHVEALRRGFAEKRAEALAFFEGAGRAAGFEVVPNDATFYLWIQVPPETTSAAEAERWLEHAGVAVVPGEAMGDPGDGFLRVALVPTLEECRAAWQRLAPLLAEPRPHARKDAS